MIPTRILLFTLDLDLHALLIPCLPAGAMVRRCPDLVEAGRALAELHPNLIVLDGALGVRECRTVASYAGTTMVLEIDTSLELSPNVLVRRIQAALETTP